MKEQNGAAMSLGRTSTFLDVYLQRDLAAGRLTEQQAQELIDDFVIKLRIVRFLRTPEYDELFSGDPTWVTESIGGMGEDGRTLVTKHVVPVPADPLQPGPGPRAEPDGVLDATGCPTGSSDFCAQVSIDTSAMQYESDDLIRASWGDDAAIACCVSPMRVGKQMQFFGARVNLAKTLLYAINGGRDEITGKQVAPAAPAGRRRRARLRRRRRQASTRCWTGSPQTYVDALNCIHFMHDKYAYERLEMALHDREVLRTMACGIAGLSVVADSLVGDQVRRRCTRSATTDGLVVDYVGRRRRSRPTATTTTGPTTSPSSWSRRSWRKIRRAPDVPRRDRTRSRC